MKSEGIYNETTLNKLEDYRDKIRGGQNTPTTRRAAATYQRLSGCGVKPGTKIRTTYKNDRKHVEVIKDEKK